MKELAPFMLQGLFMAVDEFYCHHKRPLKRWERLGHPLDTLSFGACFALLYFVPPSQTALIAFVSLSIFSCLLISKDEWQHQALCSGFENWLHSLLFILHPVVLIWTGYLWWSRDPAVSFVLPFTLLMTFFFFLYQSLYWNVWRRDRQ